MPLYTVFVLLGRWPFGNVICDLWLTFDYVLCNASVSNLLVICCDRYLSLTRPLTYRASRTPKKVFIMISAAWVVSIAIWSPWIFGWSYIEGKRTVPPDECYIQFLAGNDLTSRFVSLALTVVAFYGPVGAMCVLYFKVYGITRQRTTELKMLQANRRPEAISQSQHSHSNNRPSGTNFPSGSSRQSHLVHKMSSESSSHGNRRFVKAANMHSVLSSQHSAPMTAIKQQLSDQKRPKSASSHSGLNRVSAPAVKLLPSRPMSIAVVESTDDDSPSSLFFNSQIFSEMKSIDSMDMDSSGTSSDSTSSSNPIPANRHAVLSRLSLYLEEDKILRTMAPVITALRNSEVTSISGEPTVVTINSNSNSCSSLSLFSRVVSGGFMSMVGSFRGHSRHSAPSRVVFDEESLEPVPLLGLQQIESPSKTASSSSPDVPASIGCSQVASPVDAKPASTAGSGGEVISVDVFPTDEIRRQSMFAHFRDWSANALRRGKCKSLFQ